MKTYESSDVLYILTISGDLADYYDGIDWYGEEDDDGNAKPKVWPSWDELDDETKRLHVRSVRRALDGFMEDRYIAFDAGLNR